MIQWGNRRGYRRIALRKDQAQGNEEGYLFSGALLRHTPRPPLPLRPPDPLLHLFLLPARARLRKGKRRSLWSHYGTSRLKLRRHHSGQHPSRCHPSGSCTQAGESDSHAGPCGTTKKGGQIRKTTHSLRRNPWCKGRKEGHGFMKTLRLNPIRQH